MVVSMYAVEGVPFCADAEEAEEYDGSCPGLILLIIPNSSSYLP